VIHSGHRTCQSLSSFFFLYRGLKHLPYRGYEAYDRLSPSFAKYLETLEAVHEARFFQQIADGEHIRLREGESTRDYLVVVFNALTRYCLNDSALVQVSAALQETPVHNSRLYTPLSGTSPTQQLNLQSVLFTFYSLSLLWHSVSQYKPRHWLEVDLRQP
jgi:hypothetical protein